MIELTFHCRLRQLCIATRVPSPIPGTRELPIEVVERSNRTRIPDERSMLTREQSMHAPKLPTRTCSGAYLAMPNGVLPYSAYPFMLHEQFALPWNIHVMDHRMSIHSIKCTGVRERSSESCEECSQLLTHRIVEGILHWIKNRIHTHTNYAYQPIGGLIGILRKKSAMLDGLHFKQLSASRTLAAWARTVGQYERLVMAMGEGKVNRLDALLRAGLNRGLGARGMIELLDRVKKGLYKPKSFTEEEMSRGCSSFGWVVHVLQVSLNDRSVVRPLRHYAVYLQSQSSPHCRPQQLFLPSQKYNAISEPLSRTHQELILDVAMSS